MSYQFMEFNQLALAAARFCSDLTGLIFSNPVNPLAHTPIGRSLAASYELFARMTRPHPKPAFGLTSTD